MSAPTGAGQQPSGKGMTPTQQQNVSQLKSDLSGIKQGSQVTPAQKEALKGDLNAMAQGATKPDPALVDSLATSLSDAVADGSLSIQEKARLASDIEAVMNSANISPAEAQKAIADAQAILKASGVSQSDVQAVVKDLQAIAAEAQSRAAGSAGGSTAGDRKFRGRR